ncbi:FAD-dependent monooxygenase, partial [Neobacillus drentensis]
MNLQADVCIVGGGPAGTLLGHLLAKNGVSTIIIEL